MIKKHVYRIRHETSGFAEQHLLLTPHQNTLNSKIENQLPLQNVSLGRTHEHVSRHLLRVVGGSSRYKLASDKLQLGPHAATLWCGSSYSMLHAAAQAQADTQQGELKKKKM